MSTCDYPGCGTELKPLFNSLYCPNEENHGKMKTGLTSGTMYGIGQWIPYSGPTPSYAAQCTHPVTITQGGATHCRICGEEVTTPWP